MRYHEDTSIRKPATVVALAGLAVAVVVVALLLRGGTASANPRTDFVEVSVGSRATCGLTSAGAVECWGGLRGTDPQSPLGVREAMPVPIAGLESNIATISFGAQDSACAMTTSGDVVCWGPAYLDWRNPEAGQVPIRGIEAPAVALSTGGDRACALTTNGDVYCWSHIGFTSASARVAAAVPALGGGVTAIASGGLHACALTSGGAVMCWGENEYGQLGNGTTSSSSAAAPVAGLQSGVVAVTAGALHSCALTQAGAVFCWGHNRGAELGSGGGGFSDTPVSVEGFSSSVTEIRAGFGRTCVRLDTGGYECWGGQFGSTPAPLPGAESAVADVTLGFDHACLLMEDGRIRCWGSNGMGQLGDGTTDFRVSPVDVVATEAKAAPTPTPCPAAGCPVPTPAPPCAAETCMGLAVLDGERNIVCHSARSADCDLPVGSDFTLAVDAFAVPEAGYFLVQSFIQYGRYDPGASEDGAGPGTCRDFRDNGRPTIFPAPPGSSDGYDWLDDECMSADLVYEAAVSPYDEVVWPDVALALNYAPFGFISNGGFSGLLPPLTVSTHTGFVVKLAMSCSPHESVSSVDLLPKDHFIAGTSGAAFAGPEEGDHYRPDVSGLRVGCCDETVTSVDALFILQFEADLTDSVSCGFDGDVDADGDVDSIDAALTLQFVAGLLDQLPRDIS